MSSHFCQYILNPTKGNVVYRIPKIICFQLKDVLYPGEFYTGRLRPEDYPWQKGTLLSKAWKRYPFRAEPPQGSTLPPPVLY